jgi:hypothetical protein
MGGDLNVTGGVQEASKKLRDPDITSLLVLWITNSLTDVTLWIRNLNSPMILLLRVQGLIQTIILLKNEVRSPLKHDNKVSC